MVLEHFNGDWIWTSQNPTELQDEELLLCTGTLWLMEQAPSPGWCRSCSIKALWWKVNSTAWVDFSIKSTTRISAMYILWHDFCSICLREPHPHGVCPRHPLSPPNDSGIPSVKSVVWGSFWYVPGVWWWSFLECLNNRKSDFGKKMSHIKGIVSPTHPLMTTSFPIVWHLFWLP